MRDTAAEETTGKIIKTDESQGVGRKSLDVLPIPFLVKEMGGEVNDVYWYLPFGTEYFTMLQYAYYKQYR